MTQPTRQLATYSHYKGGLYVKLMEAFHTETSETMVIYACALSGAVFCRPKAQFEDTVTTPNYTGPRFIAQPQNPTKTQIQSLTYDQAAT